MSNLFSLNEIGAKDNTILTNKIKTRNIQIVKNNTHKLQDKIVNSEYIYLNLKSLSDRLMSISSAHPSLLPILELISKEYKDLFYAQKRKHDQELSE